MNELISFGQRLYKEAVLPSAIMAGIAIVITVAYWVVRFATPVQVQVLSAALTPAIAMLAVAVAVAQWRTARNKLKLDLFDRRYAVYIAAHDALVKVVIRGDLDEDSKRTYLNGVRGARWLFNKEIFNYLDGFWARVLDLDALNARIAQAEANPNEDAGPLIQERVALKNWFKDQVMERITEKVFAGDLTVTH